MRTIANVVDTKNNFDAIRLLAAIGVIFSHAYPATRGSNKTEPIYLISAGEMTVGEFCVAIFFVISGFLITQSFIRSKSGSPRFPVVIPISSVQRTEPSAPGRRAKYVGIIVPSYKFRSNGA